MAGPESNGRLRRDWRHEIMAAIAHDDGHGGVDYDPALWNRLNELVARMVAEAQAEVIDAAVEIIEDDANESWWWHLADQVRALAPKPEA